MKLCMLDIETMGNKHDAVVLSIGALMFDPSVLLDVSNKLAFDPNVNDDVFYHQLDPGTQPNRKIDWSTVQFWAHEVRLSPENFVLFNGVGVNTSRALSDYWSWYMHHKPDACYCYGATFDHIIVNSLFDTIKFSDPPKSNPTHYRDQLCMRTLVRLTKTECPELPKWLVNHNALHDCIRQVLWFQAAMRSFR